MVSGVRRAGTWVWAAEESGRDLLPGSWRQFLGVCSGPSRLDNYQGETDVVTTKTRVADLIKLTFPNLSKIWG